MDNVAAPDQMRQHGSWQRTALRALGTLYVVISVSMFIGLPHVLERAATTQLTVAIAAAAFGFCVALFFLIQGQKLRALKESARRLAALPPIVALFAFPVGTVIGAGLLYVLFCKGSSLVFAEARTTGEDRAESANYFLRHWRGEMSLAASYWINAGLLGYAVLVTSGSVIIGAKTAPSADQQTILNVGLIVFALMLGTFVWTSVGVWRSARYHVEHSGERTWAWLARSSVLAGPLAMVAMLSFSIVTGHASEVFMLALGHDSLSQAEITVSADHQTLMLRGPLGQGSARAFARELNANPAVRVVQLESKGGWSIEAFSIAEQIRARGLATYVERKCESACTLIFVAGRERAATPHAKFGFHRGHRGTYNDTWSDEAQRMLSAYRATGASDAFVARIAATSSNTMWYPTHAELVENHVVTRTTQTSP